MPVEIIKIMLPVQPELLLSTLNCFITDAYFVKTRIIFVSFTKGNGYNFSNHVAFCEMIVEIVVFESRCIYNPPLNSLFLSCFVFL